MSTGYLRSSSTLPLWERVAVGGLRPPFSSRTPMLCIGYAKSVTGDGLRPIDRLRPLTRLRCFASQATSPTRGEVKRSVAIAPKRTSRHHGNRREVHEPALRLHEAFDLGAHRARRDVMGDIQKCRVVDRGRMQFGQRGVTRRRIEGLARLGDQLVE